MKPSIALLTLTLLLASACDDAATHDKDGGATHDKDGGATHDKDGGATHDAGADLSKSRSRWLASRPARFAVQTCTHGVLPPGCVRAVVEDGAVVVSQERIYAYLGDDLGWEDIESNREPLEQMFDDALSPRPGCRVESVDFDDRFLFIDDYRTQCEDDTVGGRYVACFRRDETRIDACDVVPEGAQQSRDGGAQDGDGG